MPTIAATLQQARKRLGIQEQPPHSNRTPIGSQFGWNGVAWCAEYVCVVLQDAGFNFIKTASAPGLRDTLAGKGWHPVRPHHAQAGDVVFFSWPGTSNSIDHTGLVEGRKDDGRLITLEGNTTLANGNGGVARKVRALNCVAAVVRPPYSAKVVTHTTPTKSHKMPPTLHRGSTGPWVRTIQIRLGHLAVTGNFGSKTEAMVMSFQRKHSLADDGIVGRHTWKALGW